MKTFTNNGTCAKMITSRDFPVTTESIEDDYEQALWIDETLFASSEEDGAEYSNRQDIDSYC